MFDDLDGVWNFIYFGYSAVEEEAFFFMKCSESGKITKVEWENV